MAAQVPELVSPAGTLNKMRFAFAYGADAVYAGAAGFSMRPKVASLTVEELEKAVALKTEYGKKLYVGINSLAFAEDLDFLARWLDKTRALAIDAVIVGDAGVFSLVKEKHPALPIHISTQMSLANSRAVQFWKNAGAARVVLARECSLRQAAEIARTAGADLEMFVHGAMCMAVSGRCLLSAHLTGESGNRGLCKHTCRWEYQLVEQKRPESALPVFETGRETIFLGSTDLCLIEHLPEVIATGVKALKIEGRMKSEYYVAVVTRIYREALDAFARDPERFSYDRRWKKELEKVGHRTYAPGFAFGYPEDPSELQTQNRSIAGSEVIGYIDRRDGERYFLEVKNAVRSNERLNWFSPDGSCGTAVVRGLWDEDGAEQKTLHPGRNGWLDLQVASAGTIPALTVLRRG